MSGEVMRLVKDQRTGEWESLALYQETLLSL